MARTRVTASPQKTQSVAAQIKPTQDEIALRAYHIYLERSCTPGNAFDDWIRAERELTENHGKPRRKQAPKSAAA
jgi:hypothetical protein